MPSTANRWLLHELLKEEWGFEGILVTDWDNVGLLPLESGTLKKIAVVGPNADDAQAQLGDWAGASGQAGWILDGHPRSCTTTVLDGIRALAPEGCEVTYAKGGRAIAEAVFGHFNPSGRLTVSIPFHVGQQPVYYSQVRGRHGDRYADLTQEPHFPFGFGLPVNDCSLVNAAGERVVEPGDFELRVGPGSRDADLLKARFRHLGA